jgi:hypothetical protein
MKNIPILFSTPMVQAILAGRKTQTRRVVKPQPPSWCDVFGKTAFTPERHISGRGESREGYGEKFIKCPYGQPGDVLWVRESWQITDFLHVSDENYGYIYKASENGRDWEQNSEGWKWKPSIHMPKAACRIWLKVTGVRVERLQQIPVEDCTKEGIEGYDGHWKDYLTNGETTYRTTSFVTLWKSINGIENWNANPWVWVISFEPCDMPADFLTAKTN